MGCSSKPKGSSRVHPKIILHEDKKKTFNGEYPCCLVKYRDIDRSFCFRKAMNNPDCPTVTPVSEDSLSSPNWFEITFRVSIKTLLQKRIV